MARGSTKENKTVYQLRREELGLSREKAGELLEVIPPERIERIESGKYTAHPDEVLVMADKYQSPHLCNYYCAHECEIGQRYVPEVRMKELSQIVLETLASVNTVKRQQDELIEITADGRIEAGEMEDFVRIQSELEKISVTVETLQLWVEQKIASGELDQAAYEACRAARETEDA
ncbi:MAG: helix-turn-helix transcriptional regulator [Lachnospiraceae bacterium]|nr:helix-turn-helix transcriptional regulator [Lachnospiraceae bacterium]